MNVRCGDVDKRLTNIYVVVVGLCFTTFLDGKATAG